MIRIERPPNFDEIVKVFPKAADKGVLFAYGEDIFNPSNVSIPTWIAAHEYKHCARQFLSSPEAWWQQYLTDQEFRYREELIAHNAEMIEAIGLAKRDRNVYAKILDRTARRVVAHLYNYDPPKSYRQAMIDVQNV